jgi:Spy/CpxP family protein refolding chaperone
MKTFPSKSLALIGSACILIGCGFIFSNTAMSAEAEHRPPTGRMMGAHLTAPKFLRGVQLDEAQQDKVFAIMHAQEPLLREQFKAEHHAHEALRALAVSGRFDDARASALAEEASKANAAATLQRARSAAQIYALLTPEQRRKAAEGRPHREPRS